MKIIKIATFIIFIMTAALSAASSKESKEFLKKLEKKSASINTFYADLITTGYDQDNNMIPVKIRYWKDRDKIKKIITDSSETVTTYVFGDSFIVHYSNSNIILNNNLKNLSDTELSEFKMQNNFLEYYKLNELLKKFDVADFSNNNGTAELFLTSKNKSNDKIKLFFDNNFNLKKIIISTGSNKQENATDYTVIFNKITINEKISESVFKLPVELSNLKRMNESEYY